MRALNLLLLAAALPLAACGGPARHNLLDPDRNLPPVTVKIHKNDNLASVAGQHVLILAGQNAVLPGGQLDDLGTRLRFRLERRGLKNVERLSQPHLTAWVKAGDDPMVQGLTLQIEDAAGKTAFLGSGVIVETLKDQPIDPNMCIIEALFATAETQGEEWFEVKVPAANCLQERR